MLNSSDISRLERTDEGAAVKHLIGELKLSEEIAVSGGFDLKSIQKAVAEAKEVGASQQKLLETFKQRYPKLSGFNDALGRMEKLIGDLNALML